MPKQDSPQALDLIELAKYETDPLKRLRLITAARTLMLVAAGQDLDRPQRAATPANRIVAWIELAFSATAVSSCRGIARNLQLTYACPGVLPALAPLVTSCTAKPIRFGIHSALHVQIADAWNWMQKAAARS
jgi:hypothetical protein